MAAKRSNLRKPQGNAQRQALWAAWVALDNEMKNNMFVELKRAACVELKHSAARFARLGTSDEEIYETLFKLMGVYRQVVELGQEFDNEVMAGLCEVLSSRLKEFAEVYSGEGNPVLEEKRTILDAAAVQFCMQIDNIAARTEDAVKNDCLLAIYPHFQDALHHCVAKLDNLHSRTVTAMYTSFMEREWEELGNIIKVQIIALESAASDTITPVETILNSLREIYQHIGPVIHNFQKLLHLPPGRSVGLECEEFVAALGGAFDIQGESQLQMSNDNNFFCLLDKEVQRAIGSLQKDVKKAAHQMQRLVSSEKTLANAITKAFEQINLPTLQATCTNADIVKGIAETIAIKIESLQENMAMFDEESQTLLLAFSQADIISTDAERHAVQEAAREAWLAAPPQKTDIPAFFEKLLANMRAKKLIATHMDKMEKCCFRFKKDVLLFEICTFEEILTHSVSRIRESEIAEITAVAATLDAAYANLENLLKKNNIVAIRPAPHQQFNAFEHEVLVAEKLEGFNKGEIIKIINTGYKQRDKVILRANVVAAR